LRKIFPARDGFLQEKFDKIWSKVTENTTPYGWYNALSLAGIFFENMKTSFDYVSDSMPKDRKKLIHSVGAMGLVEFIAEKDKSINPYTGIFRGCSHVVIRLSLAKEPNEKKKKADEAFENFTPGFGIKFLRNKVPAADSVAMFGVNGQNSWNFFKNEFSNHIAPAEGIALALINAKFSEATKYTTKVGTLDMASYDQDGNFEREANFPYKTIYRPTQEATNLFTDYFSQNFLLQLATIPEGTTLYELHTLSSPTSNPVKIGKFVLRRKFTSSQWGDKGFWIRHNYMDLDFNIHPEWNLENKKVLQDEDFQKFFKNTYGFEHPQ